MKPGMRMRVAMIGLALGLFLPHRDARAATYPLEIIQPQAGLDTRSRYYKAYPGIPYNVRIAVIGGTYPLHYDLTSAPAGMIITPDTGEITWAAPAASASVTVRVTDVEGTVVTRSWPITVTTTGFYFIDAVNGRSAASGGTGSFLSPWKSIRDMYQGNDYASKSSSSYRGGFLYFRNGTYLLDGYMEDICGGVPSRLPLVAYAKPLVWMAYPGESPVVDLGTGYIQLYGGSDNTYFSGLTFQNITNCYRYGIRIDSDASNMTFYKNVFRGLTPLSGHNNQSAFMLSRGPSPGNYWSFQNNEFYEIRHGYGIIGYLSNKVLVEGNTFHDFSDPLREGDSHAIGPKESTTMWFIRGNRLYNITGDGIWVMCSNSSGATRDMDVSFNLVQNLAGGNSRTLYAGQANVPGGIVNVYRNTFVGGTCLFANVASNNGPWNAYQNVVVNDNNVTDHITCSNCTDPTRLVLSNNLSGYMADGLTDALGNLTSAFAQFVGSRGYQTGTGSVSTDVTAPAAVTSLAVTGTTGTSITVRWTAPGDDGTSGTAASYDIRYSTSPITTLNWGAATQASGEPLPSAAGTQQTFTIGGLAGSTAYYVAMKTSDEAGNVSGLSNVPSGTTLDSVGPDAVRDLAPRP